MQTTISLRRSDTVDVKFQANGMGKIVAVPHATLERACAPLGIPLTDAPCLRVAAECLSEALRTGADAEGGILTLSPSRTERLVEGQLGQAPGR